MKANFFITFFIFLVFNPINAQNMSDTIDIQWITTKLARTSNQVLVSKGEFKRPIDDFIPPLFEEYVKILHPFVIDLDQTDKIYKEKDFVEQYKEKAKLNLIKAFNLPDTLKELDYDVMNKYCLSHLAKKHQLKHDTLGKISMDTLNSSAKEDMAKYIGVLLLQSTIESLGEEMDNDKDLQEDHMKNVGYATWREICEKYDFVYHNELNYDTFFKRFKATGFPRNLYLPKVELPKVQLDMLVAFIKEINQSQQLYYQLDHNYNQAVPTSVENLIDDRYEKCVINGGYIFDASRQWLIYNDPRRDLEVTLFAGTKKMINLLKKTGLEIMQCSPQTRVDWYSDKINK